VQGTAEGGAGHENAAQRSGGPQRALAARSGTVEPDGTEPRDNNPVTEPQKGREPGTVKFVGRRSSRTTSRTSRGPDA
jgi:hypothetical protein